MVRVLGKAVFIVLGFFMMSAVPGQAAAETLSISQTITITARVAPARSIIVNDTGRMTKIYSNTDEDVAPRVYLNDVPGPERPLTPQLLVQYKTIISQQNNLNGVVIPVPPPLPPKTQPATKLSVASFFNKLQATTSYHIALF